ncbi:hypothetical protein A176_005997 [Myxococcus hansupus]|uniref:Uncharacterized protein n=1 Tax=Pseudomyxococcus hansupus TaxID=1297742 RepID=A0A0H4X686_9BACT|nr:hypothetical protein A176_005997 [Myxococcus hansupus]
MLPPSAPRGLWVDRHSADGVESGRLSGRRGRRQVGMWRVGVRMGLRHGAGRLLSPRPTKHPVGSYRVSSLR